MQHTFYQKRKTAVFAALGMAMFAMPILARAQASDPPRTSLVAELAALVKIFEQELGWLFAPFSGAAVPAGSDHANDMKNAEISIDPSVLQSSSTSPTISGSARADVTGVMVHVFDAQDEAMNVDDWYSINPVEGGRWSFVPKPALPSGVYSIKIFAQKGEDISSFPSAAYTLVIRTDEKLPKATASIDASSLAQIAGEQIAVTGTKTNTSQILVALVSSSYAGPTDYETLKEDIGSVDIQSGTVLPESDRWHEMFYDVTPGSYTVYVFDTVTRALLVSAKLEAVPR